MFHDNDKQLVVNLDYEFRQERTSFMITKTLFIRCYTINSDLSLNSVQHNIMQYIIALTNNSLSQSNFKRTTYHHMAFLI